MAILHDDGICPGPPTRTMTTTRMTTGTHTAIIMALGGIVTPQKLVSPTGGELGLRP